jgi:hypothetical protein
VIAMRLLILPLLICPVLLSLAGCAADPKALGITGPGQLAQPRPATEVMPGGDLAAPDMPNSGNGRFWGYN